MLRSVYVTEQIWPATTTGTTVVTAINRHELTTEAITPRLER